LILSYVFVGAVLLLLFSAIVVNSIYRNSRGEALRDLEVLLEQNFRTVEGMTVDVVENINERFISDDSIIMGLFTDVIDRQLMYDIHATLREMARESRIIDSIYLYNAPLNMAFSSLSAVRPPEQFYERNLEEQLRVISTVESVRLLPRHAELRFLSVMPKNKRWVSLVVMPNIDGTTSAVVANISQDALQDLILRESADLPKTIDTWIISNDGTVISHSDATQFAADVSGLPHVRRIMESASNRGRFETTIDGRRVAVGYIKSSPLDCFFVTVVGHEELLREARRYRNLFIAITIGLLIAVVIESLFFTRIIYSPLDSIVREAEVLLPVAPGDPGRSEYEIVSSLISYTSYRLSEAQRRISDYVPERKRRALLDLLQDTVSVDTPPDFFEHEYDIELDGPYYAVALVVLHSPIDSYTGYERLLRFQRRRREVIEEVYQGFSERYRIEIVDVSLRQIAVIANLQDDRMEVVRTGFDPIAAGIDATIRNGFNTPGSVFVGPVVSSVEEIPNSYVGAVELSRYRLVFSDRQLITSADGILESRADYEYPIDIEKRILDQIALGHKDDVRTQLDEFSRHVSRFRYNEILLSLTQLVLMISRRAYRSIEMSIQEQWARMVSEQRLTESKTLVEVFDWISEASSRIIDDSQQRRGTEHAEIAKRVRHAIDEGYADSSLCAATLADDIGLSTNYLRSIFKSSVGVSMSDYIARTRFEHAKELLLSTDRSAKEIAMMCGFCNADYFYHSFRKRTGESPSRFRRHLGV
jgi:AraC-like DNA-binding protein